jgi:glycosyltransferase involved in cell wall biosynthesis
MKSNSAIRRLLVITYHFPPDGSVGGQRWAGLSKYLARLGWEVHVITAALPGENDATPYVHRHVRHRRRTLNDFYRSAIKRRRGRAQSTSQTSPAMPAPPRSSRFPTLTGVRRVLGSSMNLPDQGRGWVLRAAGAARSLLRERRFDVVVSSGPPHSAHFAALLGTRGRDTPYWIDMRDPWSVTHEMNTPDDPFVSAERWILRRLEKLVFPRAARVLVNTREFAAVLRKTDPELEVVHFPNGIDLEQLPARNLHKVERGSIACIGTLYAGRSLSIVFAAISRLLKDRPESASTIHLDIAGQMEPGHRAQLESEIAAAGLSELVTIHGTVPRARALELLGRSHLALVLAQDQPMCIPAKLYECVGAGIPTLVVAEEASATALEARRIGAMSLARHDVDGMRSLLDDMLADRLPTTIAPKSPISYADLATEMDRLLRSPEREMATYRNEVGPYYADSHQRATTSIGS